MRNLCLLYLILFIPNCKNLINSTITINNISTLKEITSFPRNKCLQSRINFSQEIAVTNIANTKKKLSDIGLAEGKTASFVRLKIPYPQFHINSIYICSQFYFFPCQKQRPFSRRPLLYAKRPKITPLRADVIRANKVMC